jgi:xanthine/uracil/vitamin C permease (AzgA family)
MIDKGLGIFIALIGLASLAVIVSKKSDTAKVIGALMNGFTKAVKGAVSPVTGK